MKTWKLLTLGAFALTAVSTGPAWAQKSTGPVATGPMGLGPNYRGMLDQPWIPTPAPAAMQPAEKMKPRGHPSQDAPSPLSKVGSGPPREGYIPRRP